MNQNSATLNNCARLKNTEKHCIFALFLGFCVFRIKAIVFLNQLFMDEERWMWGNGFKSHQKFNYIKQFIVIV